MFIKLDLFTVTVGTFFFHFSYILGSIVDCVNVNLACAWHLNHALNDVQNMCTQTKGGTVLNIIMLLSCLLYKGVEKLFKVTFKFSLFSIHTTLQGRHFIYNFKHYKSALICCSGSTSYFSRKYGSIWAA